VWWCIPIITDQEVEVGGRKIMVQDLLRLKGKTLSEKQNKAKRAGGMPQV
jgi:hypothetical protein